MFQIYFAAINCWHPGSECKSRYKIRKFPAIVLHVRTNSGMETKALAYGGLPEAAHLIRFLSRCLRPLTHVASHADLPRLQIDHSVSGFWFCGRCVYWHIYLIQQKTFPWKLQVHIPITNGLNWMFLFSKLYSALLLKCYTGRCVSSRPHHRTWDECCVCRPWCLASMTSPPAGCPKASRHITWQRCGGCSMNQPVLWPGVWWPTPRWLRPWHSRPHSPSTWCSGTLLW